MKKIIDGKLYDTEKAKLVTEFSRMKQVTNLLGTFDQWVDCELYQTAKGNWFEVVGVSIKGTYLNAITSSEAKQIIQNCNIDKYQEMYGDLEEA